MQNEFEKRVQQKLEELDLVPSAPVWPRIEEQIRPKKDRRRLIFWLPLFLLLIGGGYWLLGRDGDKATEADKTAMARNENPGARTSRPSLPRPASEKPIEPSSPQAGLPLPRTNGLTGAMQPKGPELTKPASLFSRTNTRTAAAGKARLKQSGGGVSASETFADAPSIPAEIRSTNEGPVSRMPAQSTQEPKANGSTSITPPPVTTRSDSSQAQPPAADSSFKKPAVQKRTAARKFLRKWELGLTASIGSSRYARGWRLFSMAKSADMIPASQPNIGSSFNSRYYQAAPANPALASGVGGVMKKGLGRKTRIVTGLQWDFYSTTQAVGKRTDSITGLSNYLNQYSQASVRVDEYRNVFHFITLPVSIEWTPSAKIPVAVHGGLALQQMVFTNALNYNYGGQYYYYDPKTFTRTQLFARFGIDAQVRMAGHAVQLGPQVQYSFSQLFRNGGNTHLLSYGLRAQWMLKK